MKTTYAKQFATLISFLLGLRRYRILKFSPSNILPQVPLKWNFDQLKDINILIFLIEIFLGKNSEIVDHFFVQRDHLKRSRFSLDHKHQKCLCL